MSVEKDLERRIEQALQARANTVSDLDLRPALPPESSDVQRRPVRTRWAAPLLAAAAVAAVVVATAVVGDIVRSRNAPAGGSGAGASPTPTAPTNPPPHSGAAPSPSPSAVGSPSGTPSPSPAKGFSLVYEPLWPFGDFAAAEQWRTSGRGAQPWHLDVGQTALSFTRDYLGFTDIDRVTSTVFDGLGAHVGVGYRTPAGANATAAILHLVRFGARGDSGWEVVGSDDTTFTLERPAYGSTVTTPMVVGGRISGVDENVRVWIRSGSAPASVRATIPAGGSGSPWTTKPLSFTQTGVLTVVASTGGHVQQVERFAIQGVQAN
jgi:hypothetical protein